MEEFIKVLNELFESNEPTYEDEETGEIFFDSSNPESLANKVELLANNWLIDSVGGCDWANIFALRELGYQVYPGEKDSFGWLTGCIEKGDRTLIYG